MSNSERVYEGTLNWPLSTLPDAITCRAPAGESLPPWGLVEDEPPPESPCGQVIFPSGPDPRTLAGIRDAIERHMREAHGEEV